MKPVRLLALFSAMVISGSLILSGCYTQFEVSSDDNPEEVVAETTATYQPPPASDIYYAAPLFVVGGPVSFSPVSGSTAPAPASNSQPPVAKRETGNQRSAPSSPPPAPAPRSSGTSRHGR